MNFDQILDNTDCGKEMKYVDMENWSIIQWHKRWMERNTAEFQWCCDRCCQYKMMELANREANRVSGNPVTH